MLNFNIHLDDQSIHELDRAAEQLGANHSGLVGKAPREWLDKNTLGNPVWPAVNPEWQGVPDMRR